MWQRMVNAEMASLSTIDIWGTPPIAAAGSHPTTAVVWVTNGSLAGQDRGLEFIGLMETTATGACISSSLYRTERALCQAQQSLYSRTAGVACGGVCTRKQRTDAPVSGRRSREVTVVTRPRRVTSD